MDVYVADVEAAGPALLNPRRLTLDDRDDWTEAWSSDGKAVIFGSRRGGATGIYKQAIDSKVAQSVVVGSESAWAARVSPDGNSILFISGESSVMRVSLDGGTPQHVGRIDGVGGFDCPAVVTRPCVSSVAREGRIVFSSFDPRTGLGREVASAPTKNTPGFVWALSPDGTRIAVRGDEGGDVNLLTLSGGGWRKLKTEKIVLLQTVSWSPSSDALFITGPDRDGRCSMLRLDLEGRSRVLHESDLWMAFPVSSPDGRHLAYSAMTADSNVWLLENF